MLNGGATHRTRMITQQPVGRRERLPLTERITYFFDLRAGLFFGVFNGITTPLIPIIARKLGLDTTGLAVLSIMQFVGFFFSFVIGHLSESRKKMPLVLWPGVASRGLFIGFALIASPYAFLAVVSVYYLLANISSPAYSAIMQANYSERFRPRIMGNIRVAVTLVTAAASLVAGILLDIHPAGYRLLFPVAALFGVASSVTFARIRVREDHRSTAVRPHFSLRDSVRELGKDRVFLIFMLVLFSMAAPSKITMSVEPIRLVDQLHINYASAGLLLGTLTSLFAVIGYYMWARLADRVDPFLLLVFVGVITGLRQLDYGLAPSIPLLVPGMVFEGLNASGWDLFSLICILRLSPPDRIARYWGLHLTLLGVRGVAGPIIGAILYETHLFRIVGLYVLAGSLTLAGSAALLVFTGYLRTTGRGTVVRSAA